jgi:hypothetical protein
MMIGLFAELPAAGGGAEAGFAGRWARRGPADDSLAATPGVSTAGLVVELAVGLA